MSIEDAGRIIASPYKLPDGTRAGVMVGADGLGQTLLHLVKLYPGGGVADLLDRKKDKRAGVFRTMPEARAALDQMFKKEGT